MALESLLPSEELGRSGPDVGPSDYESFDTTQTFESLDVCVDLTKVLADQGITTPFPIQAMTVKDGLAGRDVCGKAKTGSGKTLAFGLPMLQRIAERLAQTNSGPHEIRKLPKTARPSKTGKAPGPRKPLGLVLLPTRELVVQVHEVLRPLAVALDLRVAAVYGGADIEKQINLLRKGVEIVMATPGRLIDLGNRGELSVSDVEILVLDEADRMADMGFMPQVEWVLRRLESDHQTMLFSATLDGAVDTLVKRYMKDPVFHEVASSTQTVSAMEHRFLQVHQMDKVRVTAAICRAHSKSLVFVRTKRGADRLVERLSAEGVRCSAIHGDLRQSHREKALSQFSSGGLPVLVATDVAARGLDIDAVDVVVHYDPPEDSKTYLHRSGRTARAGEPGVAVMLLLWNQTVEAEVMQRRLGLRLPIVEVFSNDPRLAFLARWQPSPDESVL